MSKELILAILSGRSFSDFYHGIKMSPIIESIEVCCASQLGQALWSNHMNEAEDILQLHQPPTGEGRIELHMDRNTWIIDYTRGCIQESDSGLRYVHNNIICRSCTHLANLTELNLKSQRLGSVGACHLAEVLNQTQLQSLDVSCCGIGEEGIVALASALSTNTTIKHLAIGANQISIRGQECLVTGLQKNSTLVSLDIQTNNSAMLGIIVSFVEGEEEFIYGIHEQSSITKVIIDGCTPLGVHLEEMYLENTKLRTVPCVEYYSNTIECQLKPFQVTSPKHYFLPSHSLTSFVIMIV